jgi:hypothetical protein
MRSDHYLHPEFGFLVPTGRLRRELRVGLLSMLFGVGIGVTAVTALSIGSRDHHQGAEHSARTGGAVVTASGAAREDGGNGRRVGTASTDPNETVTQTADHASAKQPDASAGGEGNSADHVKGACQGTADLSCAKAGVGAARRALPRMHDAPAIARLPLGRSTAGLRQDDATASTPESVPLPREKPRKAVAGQNTLRQAGMNGHEESRTIWTNQGSQTRPGRAPTRDRSQSLRGFWAWSGD